MNPQHLLRAIQQKLRGDIMGGVGETKNNFSNSAIATLNPLNFEPEQFIPRAVESIRNQKPENISFGGEMQTVNPGGFTGALAPHDIGSFAAKPDFSNAIPDARGQNQLLIEEAIRRGDIARAAQLSNQITDPATRNSMIDVVNMARQTAPFTEVANGVYRSAMPTQIVPVQIQMPKIMRTANGGFTILKSMAK